MFAMFTPLALARRVGSSVFRPAIILVSLKKGIALLLVEVHESLQVRKVSRQAS